MFLGTVIIILTEIRGERFMNKDYQIIKENLRDLGLKRGDAVMIHSIRTSRNSNTVYNNYAG